MTAGRRYHSLHFDCADGQTLAVAAALAPITATAAATKRHTVAPNGCVARAIDDGATDEFCAAGRSVEKQAVAQSNRKGECDLSQLG